MIERLGLPGDTHLRHGRASSRVLLRADIEVTGIFPRAPNGPANALDAVHDAAAAQRQPRRAPGQ